MKKLLLRYFVLLLVLSAITIFSALSIFRYLNYKSLTVNGHLACDAPLALLVEELQQQSQKNWSQYLKKIKPNPSMHLYLFKIDELKLPKKMIDNIVQGKTTIDSRTPDNYIPTTGYKRVGHSNYVLALAYDLSGLEYQQIEMGWIYYTIISRLKKVNTKQWPKLIKQLSSRYPYPIAVVTLHQLRSAVSSERYQFFLKNGDLNIQPEAYFFSKNSVVTMYHQISGSQYILKVGPMRIPVLNIAILYAVIALCFLVMLFIVFLGVYLFGRSLDKLQRISTSFSQGDFNPPDTISKTSVLRGLYNDLNHMGQRIQQLLQSHKELIHTVSHELRTPLSRMRFIMEEFKHAKSDSDRQKQLSSLDDEVNELTSLVGELLDYARLDREKAEINLTSQVIVPLLQKLIDKQSQLHPEKQWKLIINDTDRERQLNFSKTHIERAISNLLTNAERYAKNKVILILKIENQQCQIIVDDDGVGIDPDDRNKIFEPFAYLKDQEHGYGFGLAIVKKIMLLHNGSVEVSDNELNGARFILQWPI